MSAEIKHITEPHPVSGVTNSKLGVWCFLASEIMLFAGLFSAYVLLRTGSVSWPVSAEVLNIPLATLNTLVLIVSSVTMVMAWAALTQKDLGKYKKYMAITILLGVVFLIIKGFEYHHKISHNHFPSTSIFYGIYFTLTGIHGLHVIGGLVVNTYFLFPGAKLWETNPEQFTGRIECAGLYWHLVDLVWIFLFPTLYLL